MTSRSPITPHFSCIVISCSSFPYNCTLILLNQSRVRYYQAKLNDRKTNVIPKTPSHLLPLTVTAKLIFCTSPVPLAPGNAVQLDPHAKPLGQQPPPSLAPHVYQPAAQLPWSPLAMVVEAAVLVATLAPLGATTVTPLDTIDVLEPGGHDVGLQSRPTRQQPAT